jgi:two-component system sensor histidine kinase/response regulator
VDDDVKNLQVALSILKEYTVIFAKNGKKALELCEINDFDLILLDIVMPKMNGFEVCKQLKSNAKTHDIPIIFLTAKDNEKDIIKGFDLGAVDYVTKPFYPEVLLKRVDLHLLLAKSVQDLKFLNQDLQNKVNQQVDVIREKDKLIYNHAKMNTLSQMIEMMSNQLQNPLYLIQLQNQGLQLKAMQENIDAKDLKDSTKQIAQQIDYLNQNITDFRQFFNEEKHQEEVNLKVLLDAVFLNFKEDFIKENIKTYVSGSISLDVMFVSEELKYIFMQLISNSMDAFKKRKVKRRVIDVVFNEDREYTYITYKDSAGGVHALNMDYLFDASFSTKENSSGIGLYLTKIFVEKNGGEVEVKNALDGLCFNIRIYKNLEDTLYPKGITQEQLEDIFINGIYI